MPEAGDTKEAYCATCGCTTLWEYTAIQRPDGVFGLENFFNPDANTSRFWRCCNHTGMYGNTKDEFKRKD